MQQSPGNIIREVTERYTRILRALVYDAACDAVVIELESGGSIIEEAPTREAYEHAREVRTAIVARELLVTLDNIRAGMRKNLYQKPRNFAQLYYAYRYENESTKKALAALDAFQRTTKNYDHKKKVAACTLAFHNVCEQLATFHAFDMLEHARTTGTSEHVRQTKRPYVRFPLLHLAPKPNTEPNTYVVEYDDGSTEVITVPGCGDLHEGPHTLTTTPITMVTLDNGQKVFSPKPLARKLTLADKAMREAPRVDSQFEEPATRRLNEIWQPIVNLYGKKDSRPPRPVGSPLNDPRPIYDHARRSSR